MKNRVVLLVVLSLSMCMQLRAEISSVSEALKVADFLESLEENFKDAFKKPHVRYALEELLAFYENSNQFTPAERSGLFAKLHRYFQLIEDSDVQSGAPTKFLNSDQTLVTYWSQVVAATQTILDTNNSSSSKALNLIAPLAGGFNYTYTLQMPVNQGSFGQVLSTDGNNPAQLAWITTVTSGVNLLYSATSADTPNTLVLRDQNGSFSATTITLSGVQLLNYSTVGGSDKGTPFLSVPGTNNLFIGTAAGSQTISGNGGNIAVGNQTLTAITTGTGNTAVGYNAGSNVIAGANNIYLGSNAAGTGDESNTIRIGVQGIQTAAYLAGVTNNSLSNVNFVGITTAGQLGIATSATLTTLTVTGNITVDALNGAVTASSGLLTATVGNNGTRLASFVLTDTPAVQFFQPIEPSRESYFFDDFLSFNNTAGDMFYGDTQWVIGNNTSSRVTAIPPLASNGALGVTRLISGASVNSSNYITKQLTGTTSLSLSFGYGPCINEWRASVPVLSTVSNSFYTRVGIGDSPASTASNPTGAPSNGIFFQVIDSINSGNWTINTASNGATTSATTLIAPVAGAFQRLGFQVNSSASAVTFYINGVNVGTLTTTIPSIVTGNYCSPYASVVRVAGNGGSVDLDFWYFHYTFNTRR